MDYITKPFRAQEVIARVETHLQLYRLRQQLEAANAELARRLEELQERNAELDAFAQTVAHDIKSPLVTVIGYAELLREHYDSLSDEQRRDFATIMAKRAFAVSNIVEELLLLSRVRKTDVTPEPVVMDEVVRQVLDRMQYTLQEYGAEIVLPETWPGVLGHGPWLEEVWTNYISNACKYGGRPPRVILGWDPVTVGDKAHIRFWVRDNGNGIPPEQHARLFAPFTRLSQVHIQGHGLGLPIVHRIIEKLGGKVRLESEGVPGQGSLFYFPLPATQEIMK